MSTEFITRLYGLHVDGKLHSGLHVWLQSCNLQTLQPTVSWFQVRASVFPLHKLFIFPICSFSVLIGIFIFF